METFINTTKKNICGSKADDVIIYIITRALKELISYRPVAHFLNMELAMTIYKHNKGQIAQFPYKYIKDYINESTYLKDSVKSFVDAVLTDEW